MIAWRPIVARASGRTVWDARTSSLDGSEGGDRAASGQGQGTCPSPTPSSTTPSEARRSSRASCRPGTRPPRVELELSVERNPKIDARPDRRGHRPHQGAGAARARERRRHVRRPSIRRRTSWSARRAATATGASRRTARPARRGRARRPPPPEPVGGRGRGRRAAEPRLVKSKSFEMKPMSAEDAALQMDLLHHDFYVFRNDADGARERGLPPPRRRLRPDRTRRADGPLAASAGTPGRPEACATMHGSCPRSRERPMSTDLLNKVLRVGEGRAMKGDAGPGRAASARLEPEMEKLSDAELRAKTDEFRARLRRRRRRSTTSSTRPSRCVREVGRRTLGMRLFDVQLIGAMTLHAGKIAEMKTGEGKTLAAVPAVYLNALTGRGVHVVTVNDYLASRDAEWMGPIYDALGISVGVIELDDARGRAPRAPTRPTSPTAPTPSSASTTCATTWPCASRTASSAATTSASWTRSTRSSSTRRARR